MSRLDELQTSLEDMSLEEQTELLRSVRKDRQVRKERKNTKKPQRAKVGRSVKSLLDKMDPEMRKKLLAELAK